MLKFVDGGWFAVSVAIMLAVVMITWRMAEQSWPSAMRSQVPRRSYLEGHQDVQTRPHPRDGAFSLHLSRGLPITLLHLLKHTESLPQRVVLMSIVSANTPYVSRGERLAITDLGAKASIAY